MANICVCARFRPANSKEDGESVCISRSDSHSFLYITSSISICIVYIYIYIYISVYMYLYIYTSISIRITSSISIHLCIYISIYLSIRITSSISIHLYLYVYICIYIYTTHSRTFVFLLILIFLLRIETIARYGTCPTSVVWETNVGFIYQMGSLTHQTSLLGCVLPFGMYQKENVLTQALGTEEQRGRVRGMGKFVRPHKYFFIPKTVKQYMDIATKRMSRRLSTVEDELARMKRGSQKEPVSEAASCHVVADENVEDEEPQEPDDKTCYLAVDVPSNIVAKGTVMNNSLSDGNVEVMMDICLQGEALLPFPLEDEFIEKVKDVVGYIVRWPKNLVIQCSDLAKKDVDTNAKKVEGMKDAAKKANVDENNITKKRMDKEKEIGKKRQRESGEDGGNHEPLVVTEVVMNEKKKKKKILNVEKDTPRKRTRAQRKTRVRMERRKTLSLVALMVDSKVSKVDSIKVQCEDSLFGHSSFTYLTFDDFERVFTMDEMSGSVVISYTMNLFVQIKNGPNIDHGICFTSPTATMKHDPKLKVKNIDDSSRYIAARLSSRQGNDIVLMPYNPGRHWVLGVLNMKTSTCYYLDSLPTSNVNLQFKQIVDAAIGLYDVQSGFKKKTKLKWVNSTVRLGHDSVEGE